MKAVFSVALLAAHATQALANPNAIYRCGNEYLNDAAVAQARGCSIVETSAATVTVTGTRVLSQAPAQPQAPAQDQATAAITSPVRPAKPQAPSWRPDSTDQRAGTGTP